MNKELILFESKAIATKVQNYREHMHRHPELSFEEHETASFISKTLSSFGVEHQTGIAGTGIVALITNPKLPKTSPVIAFRSELDALPILEENNTAYTSTRPGIMHACGHDVHSAILLGVAEILQKHKHSLSQNVKLIFQLGEEKLPGGASLMIAEGVLKNPTVEKIFALHVYPELEAGKIGLRSGLYMASCDELFITINGKGGHGAMPNTCIDPITIGAQIVTNLQHIVSRKADPKIPTVLSIGHFEAVGATNVIPQKAILKGTFRTMDENWRSKAHTYIEQFIRSTCEQHGASVDLKIVKGYPFLENHLETTETAFLKMGAILGSENILQLPVRMTSEDFSYFAQSIPSCFFRLGVGDTNNQQNYSVHHPKFDVNPACYETGVASFLALLWS
jgi:amidohydrolase